MSLPPSLETSPLRQTLQWAFRPIKFLEQGRERYGDAFGVRFLGFERPMYMLSDPAAIKALYTERSHGLPPGRNIFLEPILGARSLLLLEGEDHLAHRKLMLPPFHGERMRALEPVVGEIAAREVDSWPLGEEFALHPRMQAVTLEVILRVVFGVAEGSRLERLRGLLRNLLAETSSTPTQLLVLLRRRAGRSGGAIPAKIVNRMREVDELLYAEIAEHRRRGDLEDRDDILSALILARFEDGEGMSDTDLRDQLMTLLLAGHETTATALAWSFDLLLRHRSALARLRETLEAGEEDYLRATIAESLR
ncbi:MAG TPA: cytochrome P450, partial [Solirubrobacterales bacterium]|nr:cytochrome P450 [Solirubrobacterales bacterium]